ncbi:MAG: hypothetical protein JXR94_18010 [Candidatus Hydrogenedentes bacterium]|nr:hypothetical protein [Candidatus Hydrogenedentota bacterium]
MANFTTESTVRTKFQLTDPALVPTDLVAASIDDAHLELLRFLDPDLDTASPPSALIMGETLLAGAHLFRSLASKHAFEQKQVVVGGQRIEAGQRFAALSAIATLAEDNAWYLLEPYLAAGRPRVPAAATDTAPILGAPRTNGGQ